MDYKALYRKFRPITFNEVIGQEHVTGTLRNQIMSGSVAHAYLFSGIRGTGKTSTAKIFARALNCLDPKDGNPCNACENCLTSLSDNAIDIIEIDAASNNGVDDIRDLREKTKYPPSRMKYKVYIIDEVHMLSIGAFNALLKTLEEPPHYIVFIFATTEIHKIPATIISRCQKFELKRIKKNDITDLMIGICDQSGYSYDIDALEQISRLADGAARDSLSILDQCFAANEDKHINLDLLHKVLGLVTEEKIIDLMDALNQDNGKVVLSTLNEIVASGKDIKRFTGQLVEYFRYMMLAKISTDLSSMINVSEESMHLILDTSKDYSLNFVIRCIQILTKVEVDTKWSPNSRVILEVGLIKMMQPDLEVSLEAISERVDRLEKMPVRAVAVPNKSTTMTPVSPIIETNESHSVDKKSDKTEKEAVEKIAQEIPEKNYETSESLTAEKDELEDMWEDVLDLVKNEKIATHALLIDGHFEGVKDNCLCVSYKEGYGFHLIAIEKIENREIVERAIHNIYGVQLRVKYITKNQEEEKEETLETDEEKLYNFLGEHKDKLETE